MGGLNEAYFDIIVLCIANSEAYLSPDVVRTADEVYHLPLAQVEGHRVRLQHLPRRGCITGTQHSTAQHSTAPHSTAPHRHLLRHIVRGMFGGPATCRSFPKQDWTSLCLRIK